MILPDRGPGPDLAVDETAPRLARTVSESDSQGGKAAGAVPGTDFVTMADAARIKGVSYHTVSRAVRHGRLPVERVGRMALIAASDLQAWRPMTERRPRRYQQRESPALTVGFGMVDGNGSESAGRYAGMAERIMTDAATLGLDAYLARCGERLAADLGCTSLSIWACATDRAAPTTLSLFTQVQMGGEGWFVASRLGFPRTITPTPGTPFADLLASPGAQVVPAASVTEAGLLGMADAVLVAPVRVGSQLLGLVVGELVQGGLPDAELRVLVHLLKQVAFGWVMNRERAEQDRRIRMFEAVLDAAPVGIRLLDGAEVQYRNRRDIDLFPEGSPLSTMLEDDLSRHGDGDGDIVLQDTLGCRVDVELTRIPGDPEFGDGQLRSVVVSQDQSEQVAERDREERVVRALRRDVVRARAASDLARQVQGASTAAMVIQRGLPMLIAAIEGDSAMVKLRDLRGRLERIPFGAGDVSDVIPATVSPMSYPSTVLAFARRQPVIVTAYTAATFEREAMEHAGWRSMLVVPLVVKDDQLGFVMVGYGEDTQADRNVMGLASELAQVLAEAVVVARDHERLTAELAQV
ncbi:MAG: GAF domain-containing protein, partial [Thermomicrobiales bacterium]